MNDTSRLLLKIGLQDQIIVDIGLLEIGLQMLNNVDVGFQDYMIIVVGLQK